MRCVYSIHFICTISFNISIIHYTPYYTLHGPGSTWSSSQIRRWENCWLARIHQRSYSCSCFSSFTSISQFQSKGPLLFNVEIIPFFSVPYTWLKLAAWKSLNGNPVFKSFFDQTNHHHIYTHSMHLVLA